MTSRSIKTCIIRFVTFYFCLFEFVNVMRKGGEIQKSWHNAQLNLRIGYLSIPPSVMDIDPIVRYDRNNIGQTTDGDGCYKLGC